MPSATPVNAYPYPVVGDDPNIPRDIKALADRAETITNAQAALITGKAPAHRLVANTVLTSATGAFTATEAMLMSTTFISAGASEIYKVEFKSNFSSSAGAPNLNVTMRWRTGSVTLVNTDAFIDGVGNYPLVINTAYPVSFSGILTGVPAGIATVGIGAAATNSVSTTMVGSAGTPRWIRVWDEGV